MERRAIEYENPSEADVEIADEVAEDLSADVSFPCDNCGAQLTWDPDADALVCAHCDHRVEVPRAEGTVVEHALEDAGAAARGLGIERRTLRCDTCGAIVALADRATAATCAYCGSSNVLEQSSNRNAIRPESLVPIDVSASFVQTAFRSWIKGLWFRPNAIRRARHETAVGVYVPFWTYDCRVHSSWSADAGYYYWVTQTYWTTVNGKRVKRTRRVRKVRWVPKWGERRDAYDDVLVCASRGVPSSLVEKLGRFDTAALVPYRPEYLAGWQAEEYQVDLTDGWSSAQRLVEREQERRCAGDVPGDTHRALRVANTIADVRWKHVLLPIWVLHYRFRGNVHAVLVHGQTGCVVGDAPLSWVKILLLALGIGAAIAVVLLAAGAGGVLGAR